MIRPTMIQIDFCTDKRMIDFLVPQVALCLQLFLFPKIQVDLKDIVLRGLKKLFSGKRLPLNYYNKLFTTLSFFLKTLVQIAINSYS